MRTTNLYSFTIAITLLALCSNACDDETSSTELSPIGMVCNASAECITNYCDENHYCAQKPAPLLDNGASCSKSSECSSDYCSNDKVCAEKPGTSNDPGETGDPNDDSKKLGQSCTGHADCGSNFCVSNVCMTIDEVSGALCNSSDMPYCLGDYLVKCRVYAEMSYVNQVTDCAQSGRSCRLANDVAICSDACTETDLGKEKTICDEDNINWEGYIVGVEVYKCQKLDDGYFYVFDRYDNCGFNEICMGDVCF